MPYLTLDDLGADIPPQHILQALDDDGDGVADAGIEDKILASVDDEIHGTLGQRFTVPFADPVPPIVILAARILTSCKLYERRGVGENPFAARAKAIREKLDAIARGAEPLDPLSVRQAPSVSIVSEKSKLQSSASKLSV